MTTEAAANYREGEQQMKRLTQKMRWLTPTQWHILGGIERDGIVYGQKQSGNALVRRGLIEMSRYPNAEGDYTARLTAAGVEVLNWIREQKEAGRSFDRVPLTEAR
jgi:hypothetical protein